MTPATHQQHLAVPFLSSGVVPFVFGLTLLQFDNTSYVNKLLSVYPE